MKASRRSTLTTIFFGLGCGICLVPISSGLSYLIEWPQAVYLTLWSCLVLYSFLLTKWGRASLFSTVFPLLLLFVFAFQATSHTAFVLSALVILGWIRSGICFRGSGIKAIGVELMICLGGGALVFYFPPHTPATWALMVWACFLIQSLYFVMLGTSDERQEKENLRDPFEEMRRRAERIIAGGGHQKR